MSIGATVWGRELENSTLAEASGINFHVVNGVGNWTPKLCDKTERIQRENEGGDVTAAYRGTGKARDSRKCLRINWRSGVSVASAVASLAA